MALLRIRNLTKTFPIEGGLLRQRIGTVEALKSVSFDVAKGETLAIVGGSGCGKSTLAKMIVGLLPPDQGEILWEGMSLLGLSRQERSRHIQMIFQDPYASLNPKLSIGTQLLESIRLSKSRERRAGELLASVGLGEDALSHYPFQFSGGQRQRIAIARALAMNPELLIADEPLSALDVTTQAQVLDLLSGLKANFGLTMLFITHDLAIAHHFSDRVIVLENGSIVEEGKSSDIFMSPRHAYTRALLNAVPKIPC